uniref:Codanin-1 C-terminal domain-containing protein n=1 Tax=Tetranychus urticae TaxID=32264 RepID=T1KM54_TETUR
MTKNLNHCDLDCINFEPETDCKSAFSVEKAFHSFRHQRDIFYELYNNWKSSQSRPSLFSSTDPGDVKGQFESTVNRLLSFSHDASNSYHLSKLFVSQLIRTCIMGGTKDLLSTDQLTSYIQNDRLKKLRKRLDHSNSKLHSTFNDEERFFHEFIINVKNCSFHHYLKLMLIHKILETNDCSPLSGEIDKDLVSSELNNLKPKFNQLSLTLQVLAKFLGLVVYLPFQISKSNSLQFIETQVFLRKDETCCLNIIGLLKEAVEVKKLSLTLPWIIQFLRQMDSISPRLKCYQEIIRFICKLDENLQTNKIKCDPSTRAYLINIIEHFISDYREFKYLETSFSIGCPKDLSSSIINFDEYKGLIDDDSSGTTSTILAPPVTSPVKSPQKDHKLTPRKIRPLTLTGTLSNGLSSIRLEQFQEDKMESSRDLVRELENNFLSLHPLSMVKVIDLVSDRVYSRCIKELKNSAIYKAKGTISDFEPDGTISLNRKSSVDTIRKFCSDFAHNFCVQETTKILPLLLSQHDYTQDTLDFAAKLTAHKSSEKCCQWIVGNINPQWLNNHFKSSNVPVEESEKDVYDLSGPLGAIRDLLRESLLVRKKSCPDLHKRTKLLFSDLSKLRQAVSAEDKICKTMDQCVLDLVISIIVNLPSQIDNKICQCWFDYWITFNIKLKKLVSARNIKLLNGANNISSWDKFSYFVTRAINSGLYLTKLFELDCLSVLESSKDDRLLISSIKSVISNLRSSSNDLAVLSNFLYQLDEIEFPALS